MSNYFGSTNSAASSNQFGIVTVMDVKVYDYSATKALFAANATPKVIIDGLASASPVCSLDHLQVVNLTTEGPNITINGGKYNNPLIKYGKSARCEITDALGQADALVALGGAEMTADGAISITDKFGAPVTIVGDTFVVDKNTGKHVDATIIMYQFLPDSTPSFAFDSGNAATFDLNGDLLATDINGGTSGDVCGDGNGYFYSILDNGCSLGS